MMAALLASAVVSSTAHAQLAVELVASAIDPEAPAMLTLTASTPPDEAILGYEWRGIGIAPRCRARDCTIDLPVASCRRVELSVTDRFGTVTTVEEQICAKEGGASPPRAKIEVIDGEPIRVIAASETGSAAIAISRLWIDDREVEREGEIPQDGECHVVELLVADEEGRVGLDQRFVCDHDDAPQIVLGADPTFCPREGETLRVCAEVIDPLGRGVDAIGGQSVPLDGCADLIPSKEVDRIVVRGATKTGATNGSMIACTAPSSGRPNLLFARLPRQVSVVRGESRSTVLGIFGGEPPYAVTGELRGSSTIEISLSAIDGPSASIDLNAPALGTWDLLQLEVTDARGLRASVTASVSTTGPGMPIDNPPAAQSTLSCSSFPIDASLWWLLLGAIPLIRRRR